MKRLLIFTCALLISLAASAQAYQIKGVVQDDLGPVIGATVMEAGTSNGTSTGLDGDFLLTVSGPDALIDISCMGYATQSFKASEVPALINLSEDQTFLEEVVVVGYGTQKAKDLTAPIVNIKGDELSKQATANPMSALAGMVSGVQITQSGAPGAGPSVKIRGVGSIGDYAKPLYVVDGAFMDNIDFLASSDIESLTVLKDASASAIYGVRAANGVIIVTTRKGEMGHARVSYDGYAGVQVPTNIMKLANTDQYCELYNLAFDGTTGFVPKDPANYNGVSTDWYATLVHPALTHSHSLDLSGGTEKTNYSVGLSYFFQDGIMNFTKNNYGRLNLRARLDQTMSSWLKVGFNTVVSKIDANYANSGVYYQAFVNPPVYGVYNDANTVAYPEPFDSPQRYGYGNSYGNPAASAYYNRSWGNGYRTVFSAYAEATIIPEKLKFKTSYNLDFSFNDGKSYTPEHMVGGSQGTKVSSLSKTFSYGTYHILDNTLTYSDRVGDHAFTAMLGQSTRMQYNANLSGTARSVPDFDLQSLYLRNGSYKNQQTSDGASRYNGLSFFTRGTYNYKEKYLATVTLRADGSSKYQQKWGIFPSVGLGWNISDEPFMQGRKVLDFLKLRASWGMLGNDNVPANDVNIAGASGIGSSAVFGNTVVDGIGAQTVYQNYLRWEVVTETNVGADFAMFGSRLSGEVDLYHRVTDKVVFYAPIASGGGVATLLANNGKVLNAGAELSLKWADSIAEEFNYYAGLNATFNYNTVLALEGRDNIPGAMVNGVYSTLTQVGYPIGAFWGYQVEGIFPNKKEALLGDVTQTTADEGYFKYKDVNPDGIIKEDDRTYLGSPLPWLLLGLNLGFDWKNWDFSMVMNANIGNKIFNAKRINKQVFPDGNYDLAFYKNAWRKDAKSTTYPSPRALNESLMAQSNSFFVEDGSAFSIQNVQLGYTFRNVFGSGRIRAYLSAQRPLNLFGYNGFTTQIGGSPTETGIDGSAVYPMQAIYTAGVNINF
ncbi:MAG: SusC/RagA family TonB-linked outer membrane protein [Bacteroidales bacterium]|nr:SusC/RagA family TonB-linked outer membrane protein [Bacteroidales bacterium]